MRKYSWDFDGDAEIWRNDTHDTVEECLAEAREESVALDERRDVVYVGENVPFVPTVDAEIILDAVQEKAIEHAGQIGRDWDACDYGKKAEIEELDEKMTAVLHEWMKKYGYYPEFYAVEDIEEYPIGGESQ